MPWKRAQPGAGPQPSTPKRRERNQPERSERTWVMSKQNNMGKVGSQLSSSDLLITAGPDSPSPLSVTSSESPVDDLFDPARLRLSQDFAAELGVKKALLTVPVRKPSKQDFIRINADPSYRLETAVLDMKEERETYLVDPSVRSELAGDITLKLLLTAINRQGVLFLLPIRLPGPDGRLDEWNSEPNGSSHDGNENVDQGGG